VPDCQETLVTNPGFDQTATAWTADLGVTAAWNSTDGSGNPASGALAVINGNMPSGSGNTAAAASQCVSPVTGGASYSIWTQVQIVSTQTNVLGGVGVWYYTSSDCSGAIEHVTPPQMISMANSWQVVTSTDTAPADARSMRVRLVAQKPFQQQPLVVWFDNVLLKKN
jgi:hypothetical protein